MVSRSQSTPELGTEEFHFPPRYDIFGRLVPVAKGVGIGGPKYKVESRFDPQDALEHPPLEWEKTPAHSNRSHLLIARKDRNLQSLQKVESAVRIRSREELASSQQVQGLVQGKFYAKEKEGGKFRSKLLEERRKATLDSLVDSCNHHMDPRTLAHQALLNPNGPHLLPLEKQGYILRKTSSAPETLANASSFIPTTETTKSGMPGLTWVEESKTRSQLLAERAERNEALRLGAEAALEARKNLPKKERVQKPRELGPFHHMEEQVDCFKDKDCIEFGESSRKKLLEARRQEKKQNLEAAKEAKESQLQASFENDVGPLLQGDKVWWELHRSNDDLVRGNAKKEELQQAFEQKIHAVTLHPATSGIHRGDKLALCDKRKQVPEKITKLKKYDVRKHAVQRRAIPNHFTTAAIEFRSMARAIPLDANGKKLEYDPGENQPMYSSFSPDKIFMDENERKRFNHLLKAKDLARKSGTKLPTRTFFIPKNGLRIKDSQGDTRVEDRSHSNGLQVARIVGRAPSDLHATAIRTGGFPS